MGAVYQMWIRHTRLVQCRIEGPDTTYLGEVRRGYLTKPASEFRDTTGKVKFRIGGIRRLALVRHFLDTASRDRLAVFPTRPLTGPFDGAARRVETTHGEEIVTVMPPEAREHGMANKLWASIRGRWDVTIR